MISQRQAELLKLIVEEHIKTAKAVSSNSLCDSLDCSSATIRNEMAALEDLGLIEKTHISSGRIPSEKGYRYYVDNIMEPKKLTGEDMLKLQTIFHNKSLVLSDAILRSMEIISELTSYTSIVLGNASKENR
ncbi:MAG: HTH domain-containing protein, partial [Bacilli bacterium]|nr:HTH domain-containing protein [Bacilli bacterium]